jgi:hypothetical protein
MRRTIAVNYIRGDSLFEGSSEEKCQCGSTKDPRADNGAVGENLRPGTIPGSNPPICQACYKPADNDSAKQITTLLMLVNRGTESLGPHLGECDFCLLAVPIAVESQPVEVD